MIKQNIWIFAEPSVTFYLALNSSLFVHVTGRYVKLPLLSMHVKYHYLASFIDKLYEINEGVQLAEENRAAV